ncbi:hypothetical protein OAF61_02470 [Pseudomonadales bacterium]|nr:hypothetical protein [bacterium]MDB4631338.1 hypothetical protein [Pseudomonadales bacterium]
MTSIFSELGSEDQGSGLSALIGHVFKCARRVECGARASMSTLSTKEVD